VGATAPQDHAGGKLELRRQTRFLQVQGSGPASCGGGLPLAILCVGFVLALFATGCSGPRPLKGGKAVTARKPGGVIEQTLAQSENPSQATKQTQVTVKVRTYTLPAGSRLEQPQPPAAAPVQLSTINSQPINLQPSTLNHPRLPRGPASSRVPARSLHLALLLCTDAE
jgi:hypothetical protein